MNEPSNPPEDSLHDGSQSTNEPETGLTENEIDGQEPVVAEMGQVLAPEVDSQDSLPPEPSYADEIGPLLDMDTGKQIGLAQVRWYTRPLPSPGHAWMEFRGWPVSGSLEIKEYPDETPASCEATLKVELSTGQVVTVLRHRRDGDRQELERQCQGVFDAGDVVVRGPLLLMEDETLVVVTTWEPIVGPQAAEE